MSYTGKSIQIIAGKHLGLTGVIQSGLSGYYIIELTNKKIISKRGYEIKIIATPSTVNESPVCIDKEIEDAAWILVNMN